MDKPNYLTGTIGNITVNDVTIDGRNYRLGNKAKSALILPDGSWAFVSGMAVRYFTSDDGSMVLWMGIPGKPKPVTTQTAPSNPPVKSVQESYSARNRDHSLDVGNAIMWQSMMKNAVELIRAKYAMREESATKEQVFIEVIELTDALYEASIRKMLGLDPIKKPSEVGIR